MEKEQIDLYQRSLNTTTNSTLHKRANLSVWMYVCASVRPVTKEKSDFASYSTLPITTHREKFKSSATRINILTGLAISVSIHSLTTKL